MLPLFYTIDGIWSLYDFVGTRIFLRNFPASEAKIYSHTHDTIGLDLHTFVCGHLLFLGHIPFSRTQLLEFFNSCYRICSCRSTRDIPWIKIRRAQRESIEQYELYHDLDPEPFTPLPYVTLF